MEDEAATVSMNDFDSQGRLKVSSGKKKTLAACCSIIEVHLTHFANNRFDSIFLIEFITISVYHVSAPCIYSFNSPQFRPELTVTENLSGSPNLEGTSFSIVLRSISINLGTRPL